MTTEYQESAQRHLRESGAITGILNTITEHLKHPSVAKSGISAIGAIAQNVANREILISNRAYDIILCGLAQHIDDDGIGDASYKALALLLHNNQDVFEEVYQKLYSYFNSEYAEYVSQMIIYYQHNNCSLVRF